MKSITSNDKFIVQKKSVLTDFDRRILTELYFPIIGNYAFSLYMKFWVLAERLDNLEPQNHSMLTLTTGLTVSQINEGRVYLEGLGLLQTCLDKSSGLYIYCLYAPKTPKDFFDDLVFNAMLKKTVGDTEFLRIHFVFTDPTSFNPEYDNLSASFGEVFHPDLNKWTLMKEVTGKALIGRAEAKTCYAFDFDLFLEKAIEVGLVNRDILNNDDVEWIIRCSSLYGIKEDVMATVIVRNISSENGLDRETALKDVFNCAVFSSNRKKPVTGSSKNISRVGQSRVSLKIRTFEKLSPADYLKLLQNTEVISSADCKTIKRLSFDFNLSTPIINVIFDYIIVQLRGVLTSQYAESIASTLLRNNITDVVDAMNFLHDFEKKKRSSVKKRVATVAQKPVKSVKQQDSMVVSADDLEDFLS